MICVCMLYRDVIILSTTPTADKTLYKQTVCWLELKNRVPEFSNRDAIIGNISFRRVGTGAMEVQFEWNVVRNVDGVNTDNISQYQFTQLYQLPVVAI